MSNENVERVMFAIFCERLNVAANAKYSRGSLEIMWKEEHPQGRKWLEAQARGAIAAMREPTDKQLKAALRLADIDEDLARTVWGVMQTAALEDDR